MAHAIYPLLPSATDPISRVESEIARRYRTLIVIVAMGDAAVIGILSWFLLNLPSGAPVWLVIYVYIGLPLSVPVLLWLLRFWGRRTSAMLREIQPMIRDISPQGILVMLEGSIVMRFGGPVITFLAFWNSDGAPLTPDSQTAWRWISTVRGVRAVTTATTRRGDPLLRARLQPIAAQFGARFGLLELLVPRRGDVMHQDGWAIESRLMLPTSHLRGETLRSELGRIRELLRDAVGRYLANRISQHP